MMRKGFFIVLASALFPVLALLLINTTNKNVCASYLDYILVNFNGNCYHEEDVYLSAPQIIEKHTKNLQIFNVTTHDRYIVSLFRIFRKNPKGVVFLQPALPSDSIMWLAGRKKSLAFDLWKNGYDVWLGNHRGTAHSRKHLDFSENDPQFWDYSFHEIGLYELEPQFELIKNVTKSKIVFIGFSFSGSQALVYSSLKPERAKKFVSNFILMAPGAILKKIGTSSKYFIYFFFYFQGYFKNGLARLPEILMQALKSFNLLALVANGLTSLLLGWTPEEFDPTIVSFFPDNNVNAISFKSIYHYAQIISNGSHFNMYDYGPETNKMLYGSAFPPPYPLEKIDTPIYIMTAEKDICGIEVLINKFLKKGVVKGVYSIPNYNHADFIYSKHRKLKTTRTILDILNKIGKNEVNNK